MSTETTENKARATEDLPVPEAVDPALIDDLMERYSRHHEFPLSLAGAVALYLLLGMSIFTFNAIRLWLAPEETTPELEVITFAGGGGTPGGTGDKPNEDLAPAEDIPLQPNRILDDIEPTPSVKKFTDSPTARVIDEAVEATDQRVRSLRELSGGRGGTGTGGGKGSGRGTGEGSGEGPGVMSQRARRLDRWILNLRFESAEEYLQRLENLQAILAIPEQTEGRFLIIRDLSKRPVHGESKSQSQLREINRIYWVDRNRSNAQALAEALGLNFVPRYIVAFFPTELEKELLKQELAYKGLTEDVIEKRNLETVFEAERRGNTFVVRVVEQRPRKGR